jgi:polysaccharide transporter, PST family
MSHRRTLITNFLSLSTVTAASYILPLITVPYLARVLGPEKYGLIFFAQAFVQYFSWVTDYGFNLSATREISIHREDPARISAIFSAVILIKLAIMLLCFAAFCLLVFGISKFSKEYLCYLFAFGTIVGTVLFPVWLFQGLEKMKLVALLNVLARVLFTVLIFLVIRSRSDYVYVPLLSSAGFLAAGLVSLWLVRTHLNIRWIRPTLVDVKHELREGWPIFISTMAVSLYTISNTFVLGLLTNDTVVGYYGSGERIVRAAQSLLSPLSQTLYPHISKIASASRDQATFFLRKIIRLVAGTTLLVSLGLLVFASRISLLLLGGQFAESIIVIRILSFVPFLVGLSNVLGVQTMLTFNMKKAFSNILVLAGLFNLALALALVPLYQHIGTAVSVLCTETFVTLSMFLYLRSRNIDILRRPQPCLTSS